MYVGGTGARAAAEANQPDVVAYAIKNWSVMSTSESPIKTFTQLAVCEGHIETFLRIHEVCPTDAWRQACANQGLKTAARFNRPDMMIIAQNLGASDVDAPLERATKFGHLECMEKCFDMGADLTKVYTAVMAFRHGQVEAFKLCISHGMDIGEIFQELLYYTVDDFDNLIYGLHDIVELCTDRLGLAGFSVIARDITTNPNVGDDWRALMQRYVIG